MTHRRRAVPPCARAKALPPAVRQPEVGYRFSADALILADFAAAPGGREILDLGTGCGILLLLLARRLPAMRRGVGLEIQRDLFDCARENFETHGLGDRLAACLADFRRPHPRVPPGAFDLVVSNPPFRRPGGGRRSPDPGVEAARAEVACSLPDLFRTARRAMQPAGRIAVIFLPSRLAELFEAATGAGIVPETVRFVHPFRDAPAGRVLFSGCAAGRGKLSVLPPLVVHTGKGSPTREFSRIAGGLRFGM